MSAWTWDTPYHVYGGLQDNSSWVGDSQYPGGISNSRWENIYGGDGFWMFVDPSNPDYIYAGVAGRYIGASIERRLISQHPTAAAIQGRQAAFQLECSDSYQPDAKWDDLFGLAISVSLA